MHFVYKLDTPFRGIRVSDENSSVTNGTSFFRTYYNSRLFVRSLCSIQSHVVNFQPFVPWFAIFHAFTDLFWAKWLWNWKAYKLTLKKLKLGMLSWSHPHIMCKKVERVTAKTGCPSCTKRTISFKLSGFHTETRLVQRDFIFLNLFELLTFCVFKMHHSKQHHHFSILSDLICYFSCIY